MTNPPPADAPLVTCIMPTRDRRPFVRRAIDLFRRQDWPHRELVIVDDGEDSVDDLAAGDERIRYVPLARRRTIGAKRNIACERARGSVVLHWDDDDWHAPDRIRRQVGALEAAGADIAGTDRLVFLEPAGPRAWEYTYRAARRWVVGGTLCYRLDWWRQHRFLDRNVGEDNEFVWRAAGARVHVMNDADFYVGVIHRGNTSPKRTTGAYWRAFPVEAVRGRLGADWPAFVPQAPRAPEPAVERPRITVAIPFHRARPYLLDAVRSILAQTHRDLRLVVVNDGDPSPPWDLLASIDDPRLVRFDLDANRGRYFADAVVVAATPDAFFAVQDADDWSEPDRLARLLEAIGRTGATGAVSDAVRHAGRGSVPQRTTLYPLRGRPLDRWNLHRVFHAGLFRTEALRAVGGPYGGERLGYDTLLGNLLLMTGSIAHVARPLYHRRIRADSLTASAATGLRSPARHAVGRSLQAAYEEAYAAYVAARQGRIDAAALGERIRAIRDARVTSDERAALEADAARLRAALETQDRVLAEAASPRTAASARTGVSPTESPAAAPAGSHADPGAESRAASRRRRQGPGAAPGAAPLEDPELPWGRWTIGPVAARALAARLDEIAPCTIVELGSGISTLVLAAYAARAGARLVTLEHDRAWLEATAALLQRHGLGAAVDLRLAPVEPRDFGAVGRHAAYLARLGREVDFAFIDGPPQRIGRGGTLPHLMESFAPRWEAWLHDGLRPHERACVERWRRHLGVHARLRADDAKGWWVLRPVAAVTSR